MSARAGPSGEPTIERVSAAAYRIPTESLESDGTLTWSSTSVVLAGVDAGGEHGLGYSYAHEAAATVIRDSLAETLQGRPALETTAAWHAMRERTRNFGRQGVVGAAIAAVDVALWDLKARLLGVPLVTLLGRLRDGVPIYGSGGFTSYDVNRLAAQLAGWVEAGIPRVKMKVGRDPEEDVRRVRAVREAIGPDAALFVDANGAYRRKRALAFAESFADLGVSWFEEPVPSDDLEGLRLLRDRVPAGMEVAAGEYAYDAFAFRRLLEAGAVDVLQADATRCAGYTGFLQAAVLCEAWGVPLSAHTAPALHAAVACAVRPLVHIEYFHDHVRIEELFFEGTPRPVEGKLHPPADRPGLGLELRHADVERYRRS